MNSLVAYDGESDDESPRRRSLDVDTSNFINYDGPAGPAVPDVNEIKQQRGLSPGSEERQRRDSELWEDGVFGTEGSNSPQSTRDEFVEPPPPARHNQSDEESPTPSQTSFRKIASTTSLASYMGEKDSFEKEDDRLAGSPDTDDRMAVDGTAEHEPRPPERPHSDEDEEKFIDQQLEECKELMKMQTERTSGNSSPRNGEQSPSGNEYLDENSQGPLADDEIRLPPAPEDACDPAVEAKFARMFELKSMGQNMNASIQGRKDFMNPSIYHSFIEQFELDEKGSNFPKRLFDPHIFPEDCYYDKIAEVQRVLMEKTTTSTGASTAKKAKH